MQGDDAAREAMEADAAIAAMSPVAERKQQEKFRGENRTFKQKQVMTADAAKAYADNPKEHGMLKGNKPAANSKPDQTRFVLNLKCHRFMEGCPYVEKVEINTTTQQATLSFANAHDAAVHHAPPKAVVHGMPPVMAEKVLSIAKEIGTTGAKGALVQHCMFPTHYS